MLWTLSLLVGFSVSGSYVPLGPMLALVQSGRGRREVDEVRARPAS